MVRLASSLALTTLLLSGLVGGCGGGGDGANTGGKGGSGGTGNTGNGGANSGGANTGGASTGGANTGGANTGGANTGGANTGGANTGGFGNTTSTDGPPAGNPDGNCTLPAGAGLEDVSSPTTVVGTGTAASCTSDAFVAAVAAGGIITFNCGADPVTITLDQTAKVFNDKGVGPEGKIVIDGGNLVTLSGGGQHRILYQNTCDQNQTWTTSHCQDQDTPKLTVQNLTFIDGNAKGADIEGSGGAIFVRGGVFKIVNSRFFNNVCDDTGPDVGGAAVRVLSQPTGTETFVVHSTFGGADGFGNIGSNGGGLSSIGVSYHVINTLFSHNKAIGNGANPAKAGTPGGGSGGGIYNDGNTYTLTLCGVKMEQNTANEGGGAIFYVSNDLSGHLVITDSVLTNNPSAGFETQGYPGIFYLGSGPPQVTNSTIQ